MRNGEKNGKGQIFKMILDVHYMIIGQDKFSTRRQAFLSFMVGIMCLSETERRIEKDTYLQSVVTSK